MKQQNTWIMSYTVFFGGGISLDGYGGIEPSCFGGIEATEQCCLMPEDFDPWLVFSSIDFSVLNFCHNCFTDTNQTTGWRYCC